MGIWVVILPFAAWFAIRGLWRPEGRPDRSVFRYIILWTFLPPLIFSFASQKEVTYIISSYAGAAILIGYWLDEVIIRRAENPIKGIRRLGIVFPFTLLAHFSSYFNPAVFIVVAGAAIIPALVFLVILLRKHRPAESLYLALAILLCATLIGHSPVLFYLVHNRRSKSCLELAPDVWKIVGRSSLYLYRPDDDIRGSIPFYGKRPTPEINRPEELKKILNSREKVYVIIRPWIYEALLCDPAINRFLQSMEIQPITGPEALPCLVLVSNRTS